MEGIALVIVDPEGTLNKIPSAFTNPVGFRYSADDVLGSGGSLVFVDEAAEDWSPEDAGGSVVTGVLGSRWVQLLAAVGTLGVVVADVFAGEQSKMSLAEDQYPVGEFGCDGSYELSAKQSELVRIPTAPMSPAMISSANQLGG